MCPVNLFCSVGLLLGFLGVAARLTSDSILCEIRSYFNRATSCSSLRGNRTPRISETRWGEHLPCSRPYLPLLFKDQTHISKLVEMQTAQTTWVHGLGGRETLYSIFESSAQVTASPFPILRTPSHPTA